jgi:hypothetical protein
MEQSEKARKKEGALKKMKKIQDIERQKECLAAAEAEKRKRGGGEERCMLQMDSMTMVRIEGRRRRKRSIGYILPKLQDCYILIRGTILG